MQSRALIALGTNLPFAGLSGGALLEGALSELSARGFAPLAVSGLWVTAPWPPSDQPDYHNAAAAIDPQGLSPQALYGVLREIEARYGRQRRERWAARTLDLDLLAIDDLVGVFGEVELPHPRLQERSFVLAPLAEVAPDWRHPILAKTPGALLENVSREQRGRRIGGFSAALGGG